MEPGADEDGGSPTLLLWISMLIKAYSICNADSIPQHVFKHQVIHPSSGCPPTPYIRLG